MHEPVMPRSGRRPRIAPLLEPLAFVALATLYVWLVQPLDNDWIRGPFIALVVVIPFASNLGHRDRSSTLGLRLDNLAASAMEVGAFTLIAATIVLLVGAAVGAGLELRPETWRALLSYPAWGVAQQYAMQSFTLRRLEDGLGRTVPAAALAALLFAWLHWPNVALAAVTLVAGFFWCLLFSRNPNLLTLGLSHGWLAVLLRYSWPPEWLHNLRIGPSYWTWSP